MTTSSRVQRILTSTVALAMIGAGTASPALASSVDPSTTPPTSSTTTPPAPFTVNPNSLIGQYYAAHQKQLGKPLSAETSNSLTSQQLFAGGRVMSSSRGTFVVLPDFDKAYQAAGGTEKTGTAPLQDAHLVSGVLVQEFDLPADYLLGPRQHRYDYPEVVVSQDSKTHRTIAFQVVNGVRRLYDELGAAGGRLGVPTSKEANGLQYFRNGVVANSESTNAHTVQYGRIYSAWKASGTVKGKWGYPVGEAQQQADGTTVQYFQHVVAKQDDRGTVTASAYSVTTPGSSDRDQVVEAANLGYFVNYGNGLRGLSADNYTQGVVARTPAHGYVAVSLEVAAYYNNLYYSDPAALQRLGAPVSFTMDSTKGLITHFEHGSLYQDPTSGEVVQTAE